MFTALVTFSLKGKSQAFIVSSSISSTESEFDKLAAGEQIVSLFDAKKIPAKGKSKIRFTETIPVEGTSYWANQPGTIRRF